MANEHETSDLTEAASYAPIAALVAQALVRLRASNARQPSLHAVNDVTAAPDGHSALAAALPVAGERLDFTLRADRAFIRPPNPLDDR